MRNSTTFSTTYFFASIPFLIQGLKAVFFAFLSLEGDIYGAYMHQKRFNRLISLLKKHVFIVVLFVVLFFQGVRLCL